MHTLLGKLGRFPTKLRLPVSHIGKSVKRSSVHGEPVKSPFPFSAGTKTVQRHRTLSEVEESKPCIYFERGFHTYSLAVAKYSLSHI